jgi:hypothetical protein
LLRASPRNSRVSSTTSGTICGGASAAGQHAPFRAQPLPLAMARDVALGPSLGARARHVGPTQASSSDAPNPPADPFASKEVYHDNFFDRWMIQYFSVVTSKQLGGLPFDGTYEGYVELSREIMKGRNTSQVHSLVAGILGSLLPPQSPERFKEWFPLNRRNAEINAWITTIGFKWLVGPSEVQDAEITFNGEKQVWKSGVKIKKCRYLENSGCVGMCTNMCKIPTQKFFLEQFGLPLTMNPDFETLECEMIFGQEPPPIEEDPVYNQPCFSVCNIGSGEKKACPKVDTENVERR